jgi:hypothetical protein
MPRKRPHTPGSLAQLRAVLWRTIREVEDLLDVRPCSTETVLKSAHALAQLAGAYRGVLEVVDIEARLAKLEAAAERRGDEKY